MSSLASEILHRVTHEYLNSGDFNGLPGRTLAGDDGAFEAIRDLISDGRLNVLFPESDLNPAIVRFGFEPTEVQLQRLTPASFAAGWFYPGKSELASISVGEYADRPYSHLLAQGEPKLAFRAFDLAALEYYRNDPRYSYWCDDVHGNVCISDDYYQKDGVPEHDQILIQSFGFAYSDNFDRAVALFLCDLAKLSPEHQQVWRAKELPKGYKLHPDFARSQIFGEFPDHVPIFSAFLMEMALINEMAKAMGRQPLFREVPTLDSPPRRFGFLVRPTVAEFDGFVQTLDKLLSENISKAFFDGDISDEEDFVRDDGRLEVRRRGTLQMLDLWLGKKFRPADPTPLAEMMTAFRKVRNLRQKPAHALRDDVFDQKYFREQRSLISDAYDGIRTLRLIFANHPACKSIEVDSLLALGAIRTF